MFFSYFQLRYLIILYFYIRNFKKMFTYSLNTSYMYTMYLHSLILGPCKHLQRICFATWCSLLSLTRESSQCCPYVQGVGVWGHSIGAWTAYQWSTLKSDSPAPAATAPLGQAHRCPSALHTSTFHLCDLVQVTAVLGVRVCEISC